MSSCLGIDKNSISSDYVSKDFDSCENIQFPVEVNCKYPILMVKQGGEHMIFLCKMEYVTIY